ncbi:MAG: hypothetical protein GF355_00620 [Candidatus Eisenbacteria bacterium]|nr:hypothetical protein [Candidatus Eisenbacteria bacterium]
MKLKQPTGRQLGAGLALAVILIAAAFLTPAAKHDEEAHPTVAHHEPSAAKPSADTHQQAAAADQDEPHPEAEAARDETPETGTSPSAEELHPAGDPALEAHPPAEAHAEKATPGWLHMPLFLGIFGFLGCILLIIIAKSLGALFLQQERDIYD